MRCRWSLLSAVGCCCCHRCCQPGVTGTGRPGVTRVRYFAGVNGNRELVERFVASLEARDWDDWAALLHPAVVYEIPQSRERIRGRDRYLRFNQEYPGDWHLRPKVVIADEHHGVVWFEWRLDDRIDDAMAFFAFADGLITQVTDFWPEPYEPPPGREHLVERW